MTSHLAQLGTDGADKKKTNALLNALKLEHGIRMYKPSLHHDDDDEADFEKRRMFILQSERDFKVVLDHIQHAIRNRGRTQ